MEGDPSLGTNEVVRQFERERQDREAVVARQAQRYEEIIEEGWIREHQHARWEARLLRGEGVSEDRINALVGDPYGTPDDPDAPANRDASLAAFSRLMEIRYPQETRN